MGAAAGAKKVERQCRQTHSLSAENFPSGTCAKKPAAVYLQPLRSFAPDALDPWCNWQHIRFWFCRSRFESLWVYRNCSFTAVEELFCFGVAICRLAMRRLGVRVDRQFGYRCTEGDTGVSFSALSIPQKATILTANRL